MNDAFLKLFSRIVLYVKRREKDPHGELEIECRRFPSTLFNSESLAKFPKILPSWSCGEYALGDDDYWDLDNS